MADRHVHLDYPGPDFKGFKASPESGDEPLPPPEPVRKSNEEFIQDLMTHSPFGALSQLVIITAIEKYVAICKDADPKDLDGIVSGRAWVACCQDIHDRMEARYS